MIVALPVRADFGVPETFLRFATLGEVGPFLGLGIASDLRLRSVSCFGEAGAVWAVDIDFTLLLAEVKERF